MNRIRATVATAAATVAIALGATGAAASSHLLDVNEEHVGSEAATSTPAHLTRLETLNAQVGEVGEVETDGADRSAASGTAPAGSVAVDDTSTNSEHSSTTGTHGESAENESEHGTTTSTESHHSSSTPPASPPAETHGGHRP